MLFNKRLFLVWALLVVAALMFVYCGDSDEPTEPVDPLASAALCLSDDICGVCPEGDSSTTIEVTNCGNSTVLNWTATGTSDWFSLSVASGTTPGSFTVEADTNKTTAARTGEVIITAEGLAHAAETLAVSQPLFGSIIHVSVEEWTAAAASDTSEAVTVTNCGNASVLSWSAESESSWLTMLPSSGDTPGQFEIVADSNRSGDDRTGVVTVAAAGLPDAPATITVTQPTLEPTLGVSLAEWEAYCLGEESQAISVTNCGDVSSFDWVATEEADWLELSAASGSTPGSFIITADANDTQEDRTATITVTAEGVVGSPSEITVEQQCVLALAGSICTSADTYGVFVSSGYAYVANDESGLEIVDVSDPANPALVRSYDTPSGALGVYVSGGYAYVADQYSGLQIINVSDPANPYTAGSYDTPGPAIGVFVLGDYAYVADGSLGGLQIIDVSDPASPTYVDRYDTPGGAQGVFVLGDYAYVADYNSGLQIVDVSDPANPTYVDSYATPGSARNVFVLGDYAYVADGYGSGLQIIDVSVPTNPTWVGSYDTWGSAFNVHVSGDYAYVASASGGLQIIDVSDPANPALVKQYDALTATYGVFVSGGYVYAADDVCLLSVLKVGL